MRHITLKTSDNGLVDEFIATIEGNSFGDQVITFRKYTVTRELNHDYRMVTYEFYSDMSCESFPEGCHLTNNEIIAMGLDLIKKS